MRFELGLGQRQIARSCGMGLGTVQEYLERALAAGIGWPLPEGLGEEELEAKLLGNQPVQGGAVRQRPQPDWKAIHEQLQQHRHLTLQLVWEEYRQAHPEGYRYGWFCERYQHWRRHLDVVLRQEHKTGEKMFAGIVAAMELAREPGAGAQVESGQTARTACVEDIDYRTARGLDKTVVRALAKDSACFRMS